MSDFQTVCAYAAGPKGTGKTQALWDMFISKAPRRVSIDFTGEMKEKYNPAALDVYSIEEFRSVLTKCATYQQWHIALHMPKEELTAYKPGRRAQSVGGQLTRMLNPTKTSSEHVSFSREVGGVSIDCSEAAHLVPNGRAHPDFLELFQGGRHNRLHLFMASQTPAKVDPEVRSAADYFLAFRTQEQTVWKFWSEVASPAIADVVSELPEYHCGYFQKAQQRVYVLDDKRTPYRVLDYKGRDVAA